MDDMLELTNKSRISKSIKIKPSVRNNAKIYGIINGFQLSDIIEMALIKKLYNQDVVIRNGLLITNA